MRHDDDELMSYQEEAEGRFDNFATGFEGNEDVYYDEDYEEGYDYLPGWGEYGANPYAFNNYQSTSIGRIDPNDRTLTLIIKNSSTNDAEAILFGANEEAPQAQDVEVSVAESSHKEVREESKAHPFKIAGMKMSVSDPLQFDNVLKITRKTATGSITARVYQPRNASSPQNFDNNLVDDNNFEMDVTGQDSLRFTIRAGATVVFTFTIKARANMGNLLKGNNVAELSTVPRTTGLPQLDLLRKRPTSAFGLPARPAPVPRQTIPSRRPPSRIVRRPRS
ncbi:hypothetical protein [Flavilitoribacter nigricans]|uniref:Uncharacterized protein n=1 Tax=Flavilitoribacter nigricans (strain ATCC 23147 / DSM 23189 / NBRC 102662 / NCIMB 1420 / SS-2) TaxID=1122177 RepID=A0A2D0MY62_FLAN2|nr:hypothetical protein [Flavilitoribacter nigricans]PHN01120.1 hypothetical protein CRP01_38605 [Flavilitoribacter nigricans DSM 23189 = NBRC 102662]